MKENLKIAIIGCGAVGLHYGLQLLLSERDKQNNIDVSFILRSDYESVKKMGITYKFMDSTYEILPEDLKDKIFNSSSLLKDKKGAMDWIIISTKSYSINESLRDLILPIVNGRSKIIVIMNGLGVEDPFRKWFPYNDIYGGISYIACNRIYNEGIKIN